MRRLIIRPGAIGDTILAFPAMEFLKTDFTEVWVRSEICPLIQFADRVRSIASTGIDLLEIPDVEPPAALVNTLRSFDEIVTWAGSNRPEFRAKLGSLGNLCRFLDALPDGGSHAADFFVRQVGGPEPAAPRLRNETNLRGTVVIHPLSGGQHKTWPMDRFVELEARIRAIGVEVEWAAKPNWFRFENLAELAGWMAGARLYIGNDSGITHLAAACGVPVVALFGPTDPAVWAPRAIETRIVRAGSMNEISVDIVMAQAASSLTRTLC